MPLLKRKPEYITIPRVMPEGERDLSRINAFIESAHEEHRSQLGVSEALAPVPADSRASLVDMRMSGASRALVLDLGAAAEAVVAACQAAGLVPVVAYAEDNARGAHLKLAEHKVCLGAAHSAMEDNYAVLAAAEVANAQVILMGNSRLAEDERFLGMAADLQRRVFKLECKLAELGIFGGTSKAWAEMGGTEEKSLRAGADSWVVCPKCRKVIDSSHVRAGHKTCPQCGHHFRMTSAERIRDLLDADGFEEWEEKIPQTDPLNFPGYVDKIEKTRTRTGLAEGVRCGRARIANMPFALCIMDSTFLMGSMGSVVGERIARAVERATEERLPLVIFCASGGARMQEGLVSLMQMAKISAAIKRHSDAGLPYFSVITDPTTGGVTASFAMQGDVIIAEPGALIGFAGRRVIQDTIRQELPKEFQTAEFALEHGLIDAIVERPRMRETLANLLALFAKKDNLVSVGLFEVLPDTPTSYGEVLEALEDYPTAWQLKDRMQGRVTQGTSGESADELPPFFSSTNDEGEGLLSAAARVLFSRRRPNLWERKRLEESGKRVAALLSAPVRSLASRDEAAEGDNPAWQSVKAARDTHRPTSGHYLDFMTEGFFELHGDRAFADDGAIVAGVGWIGRRAVMVITQEKGRDLQERIERNFGCPQPEGYRKSLRLMRLAEKFGLPVVCLVDTQGAFCGKEAEERGQGNAIADNLFELAGLRVPVVSVLVGEGGSGGALALALSDRVAMQEHAVYSVLSPEGFASILWKDRSRAPEAAAVMRMNAYDIFDMGIVDAVLEEGEGSASANPEFAAQVVRRYVIRALSELSEKPVHFLLNERYERFRKF